MTEVAAGGMGRWRTAGGVGRWRAPPTLLLLCCVAMVTGVGGTRVAKGVLPLRARDTLDADRASPGCRLGDRFYDLEDMWSPELEPVGVMHCIVCQCQPVVKKGILQHQGRVNCRNIKHDCPPVNCTTPELKPGQCCKLCDGQEPFNAHALSLKRFPSFRFASSANQYHIAAAPKVVQRPARAKEYLALMVGATAQTPTATSAVARGHFTLRDAALYFSVHFTGTERPRQLRIVDQRGGVLYMYDVTERPTGHQLLICGVWRPLHSDHVIRLHEGRLRALVSTAEVGDGLVAGNILSHRATAKESFSAVLRPSRPTGGGGVAMVAIAGNGAVNFIVKVAGVPRGEADTSRSVVVRFSKGSRVLHESRGELLGQDEEFAEVWTGLTNRESRMLARGALTLEVVTSHGLTLRGDVTAKRTCNVLHAVLSGGGAHPPGAPHPPGSAGAALITLSTDGTLNYLVHVGGLQGHAAHVTLEMQPTKKGRARRLCRVTSRLNKRPTTSDGWANGTCDRLNARHVHAVLHGEVYVNVAPRNVDVRALRGAVSTLLYNPDLDKTTDPGTLLSGAALSPPAPTDVAGNVWARLDDACALHYELVVSGLSEGEDAVLMAQLVALPPEGTAHSGKKEKADTFTLEQFVGNGARGTTPTLPPDLYQHLTSGRLLLKVTTKAAPSGVIAAKLHLPNRCVAKGAQSNTLGILDDQEDQSAENQLRQRRCVVDDVTYDDGDVWMPNSTASACMTCQCKGGQEECHHTVCPAPECDSPTLLEGECCPQCVDGPVTDRKCYFDGDKRFHRFGTRWHPYMPPFGYMTCAVCTCTEASGGTVNCSRRACPALDCPETAAVRRKPTDCCKVCPEVQNTSRSSDAHDIQGDIEMTGSCPFRGRVYPDGTTWHPRVQPFGRLACVSCRCTGGATHCQRQKCPKLTCARRVRSEHACCPVCASDQGGGSVRRHHRRRSRRGA